MQQQQIEFRLWSLLEIETVWRVTFTKGIKREDYTFTRPFILSVLDERYSDEQNYIGTDLTTLVEQAIGALRS